ncbi:hypothetical protein DENSPDRAFT_841666 [Dentipellis sp. KUC8613]|nr:hypothetical protein DENSPDRAFT_841666 [Dentipellis sp. KUC8613]
MYSLPNPRRSLRLLSPLDEIPLEPAFPHHQLFSVPVVSSLGLFEDTPDMANDQLPTPSSVGASMGALPTLTVDPRPTSPPPTDTLLSAQQLPTPAQEMDPPPAPRLQDMDSFSDGTALGSFTYSLTSEHDTVAFSPTHPTRSIEIWIDDVLRSLADDDDDDSDDRDSHARTHDRPRPSALHPEEPSTKRRRVQFTLPAGPSVERLDTAQAIRRRQSCPAVDVGVGVAQRVGVPEDLLTPLSSAAPPTPGPVPRPSSAPPFL